MKPSSPKRPSAAEALLEAGREHPPLRYDVEAGLLRHQQHVQSGAPLPAWAARGALPGSSLALRIAKLVIAGAVVGPLVVALWPAQERVAPMPERGARATSAPVAASTAPALAASEPAPSAGAAAPEAPPARRPAHAAVRSSRPRPEVRAPRPEETATLPAAATPTQDLPAESASSAAAPRAPGVFRVASRATPEAKPESRDSDEVRELALAERLLARDPQRALELARKGDARFPAGYLRQERAYVAIMALIELGATAQARRETERFFARYPDTPYGAQIQRALAQGAADGGAHELTR